MKSTKTIVTSYSEAHTSTTISGPIDEWDDDTWLDDRMEVEDLVRGEMLKEPRHDACYPENLHLVSLGSLYADRYFVIENWDTGYVPRYGWSSMSTRNVIMRSRSSLPSVMDWETTILRARYFYA